MSRVRALPGARDLALALAATVVLGGCYTSTAALPPDHPTKQWTVSAGPPSAPASAADPAGQQQPQHLRAFWDAGQAGARGKNFSGRLEPNHELPLVPAAGARRSPADGPGVTAYAVIPVTRDDGIASQGDAVLSGEARVVDGDTIELAGERVRLLGIDAPERDQTCVDRGEAWPCGTAAANALAAEIARARVDCEPTGKQQDGTVVALCFVGSYQLNSGMVFQGWAVADGGSRSAYAEDERMARTARIGIWKGEFVAPSEWRNGKR